MKWTFNQEHIIGILCIAIGTTVLILTKSFPGGTAAAEISGPAFFPNVLSYGLIILGIYQILSGFFSPKAQTHSISTIWKGMRSKEFLNLVIICVALLIYILTVKKVGFYATSALFLGVVLWRLGVKFRNNLISTLVFLAVIYLVFSKIFAVTLPSGILF
ncbi:MAG: tripartite tricarboxylate transporter TctB family protein [Sphaerochaeta sp.]|jgi:putative tricarboxylic transport membrane protein